MLIISDLRNRILAHERRALAKAITLLESTTDERRAQARALLDSLLPHCGGSLRIGISGVPGAGKSTFIDALGMSLIAQGHRVAVLAIDPSSQTSGGSILGDKTRMQHLSRHPHAFVRPSPSRGVLGGVAAHTRETMLLCEAAGFDIVLVETVGVGQSEVNVARMTDIFLVLQLPNAGDELQAMKKGVLELADLIAVNKIDVDRAAAERAEHQLSSVLRLLRPQSAAWTPRVVRICATTGEGIDALWTSVLACRDQQRSLGAWQEKRRKQALDWMWQIVDEDLRRRFRGDAAVQSALSETLAAVSSGQMSATSAATRLLEMFEKRRT